MKEIAIVESIKGNKAKVIIQRNAACGDCGACQVGKENMTMETYAVNLVSAKVGDKVEVEMAFKNVIKAAGIMYMVPLLSFILGAVLANFYTTRLNQGENPILSFIVGIILTVITYAIIKLLDKKGIFGSKYELQITNIL